MKEELYYNLVQLLLKNNIRVNQEELELQFLSHPSYPSLHALTGVLDHFNINNLALRIPASTDVLPELPVCFIANIENATGDHLALVEKKKDQFKLTYDRKKSELLSANAFLEVWNGIIVAIEKDEHVKEDTAMPWDQSIKYLAYGFGGLVLAYVLYASGDGFSQLHLILSLLGLVLSVFIVEHELGMQSASTNQFCNLSSKTSCDAVLNSEGATLFGYFKLSDISILTFATYTLAWLLYFYNGIAGYATLGILALLALPFTIYSLYYQYEVVKKWCPLCLGIVLVLWFQAGAFLGNNSLATLSIDGSAVLILLFSGLSLAALWYLLKSFLKRKIHLDQIEVEHLKFKRNFSIFYALYRQENAWNKTTAVPGEIVLGNPNALLEIVLVTSPLCHFCKDAHHAMERLLEQASDKVKIIIRFNTKVFTPQNHLYLLASQLLHLYATQGTKAIRKALDEVYSENANLQKWLEKQTPPPSSSYDAILLTQYDWCQENQINFTPALYLNGRTYPVEYDRADLIYFVDDLLELAEQQGLVAETKMVTT